MQFLLGFLTHTWCFDTDDASGGATTPAGAGQGAGATSGAQGGQGQGSSRQVRHDDEDDDEPAAEGGRSALISQNASYREQRRQLRARVRELEQAQVPQGGLGLTAEQAQQWQAYQRHGVPEQVGQQLSELGTLRRERQVADVAGHAGVIASVLQKIDRLEGGQLVYATQQAEVEGQQQTQVVVVTTDAAGAESRTPLLDYVRQRHADLLPALQAQGGQQHGQTQSSAQGAPFPRQNAGTGAQGGGGDMVDKIIREQEARRQEALKHGPLPPVVK